MLNLLKAWRFYLIAAAVVLALLGATYARGHHDGKASELRAEASRLEQQRQKNDGAHQQAATERAADTQAADQIQKDLSHADDAQPDSKPSAARRALACQRLRAQHAGRLPAGC